jgi:DNA repair protein RadD
MTLRPYQQRCVDAAIAHMLRNTSPFIVEAATGAGKSHIIAAVAQDIHSRTGKRILCLAPSAELVTQNKEKYIASGEKASTFSASAGAKETRYPVVFGSPKTVLNSIRRFKNDYALVIIDEAHGITPTIKKIIAEMREGNPNLRVMGLTATPYRLGPGCIYREDENGRINGDDRARDPYYGRCVAKVGARELIEQGFLTPPVIGEINSERYDTSGLVLNAQHKFDAAAVDRAYHGQGRKTAAIVEDVVLQARDRRGVMFFAATVRHAHEVLESLPPELSALVTSETKPSDRDRILKAFKAQKIKYIVNVSVLTVGFDAPHVDVIAILRKTESVGLLQQIIGRGLRLHPGKTDCLILDYTTNLADHCPDGDLFAPVVKAGLGPREPGGCEAECPECGFANEFTLRPDVKDAGYKINAHGYCMDLAGNIVMTDCGPMPAHFGRRCEGYVKSLTEHNGYERCGYRWTSKPCPECKAPNDIAARYCAACKYEIIDPNEKLNAAFQAKKKDPTKLQTDTVLSMAMEDKISRAGNFVVQVDYVTPYRSFRVWYQPHNKHRKGQAEWLDFQAARERGIATITYQKDGDFYRILGYNAKPDEPPPPRERKRLGVA